MSEISPSVDTVNSSVAESGNTQSSKASSDSGEVTILAKPTDMAESTQSAADESTQSRVRKLTEKGLEWQIDIYLKKFKSSISVLHSCIGKTESVLPRSNDVEYIKFQKNAIQTSLRATSEICDRLRGLLVLAELEDQLQQVDNELQSVSRDAGITLRSVKRRVIEIENEEFETATSFSNTTRSSRRSKTSCSSKRSEAAAEAAALRAKLKYIDLEAKTKADLEKLQTMCQIDMAEAKVGALEASEEERGGFSLTDLDQALPKMSPKEMVGEFIETCVPTHTNDLELQNEKKPILAQALTKPPIASNDVTFGLPPNNMSWNPNATEFVPQPLPSLIEPIMSTSGTWPQPVVRPKVVMSQNASDLPPSNNEQPSNGESTPPREPTPPSPANNPDHTLQDLARVLADQISISRLPPPEPSVFHGDPLKYPSWKAAFQTLIEQRQIPAHEKMHYLKKYIGGQVKDVIEQYFLLSSEDAYDDAKALLEERYGNPFVIANAYREKLDKWPKINFRDGSGLQKFADFLRQCHTAARSIGHLNVLDDEMQNKKLLYKLPDWLVNRWARIVASHKEEKGKFPPFKFFADFIVKEAKIACDPVTSLQCLRGDRDLGDSNRNKPQRNDRSRFTGGRTLLTGVHEKGVHEKGPSLHKTTCTHCERVGHDIDNCRTFLAKPLEKRKEFVLYKELCFGCLGTGHMSRRCKRRKRCKFCDKMHPSSLHGDVQKPNPGRSEETTPKVIVSSAEQTSSGTTFMNCLGKSDKSSMVVPVFVSHIDNPESEKLVYALLDTQSDTTFILESTCGDLGLSGTKVKLRLSTMHAENKVVDSSKIQGLMVRGYNSSSKLPLPSAFTRNIMPANRSHIPTPEMARKWPHLQGIADELMPLSDCEVGLLIGYNCARALVPRDVIAPIDNGPFGQRTDLGWGIVGIVEPDLIDQDLDSIGHSHRVVAYQVPQDLVQDESHSNLLMSFQTRVKELITPSDVANLMELDFNEAHGGKVPLSHDEHRFLSILEKGIILRDNHYTMPLPFKLNRPCLPNNKMLALHRLRHLRKRLDKDEPYRQHYFDFMNDIIHKGHAEIVPHKDLDLNDGSVWYIPHHGVYHPQKKDKIRVVFDCSAKFRETALNDHLLQGPDLTNTLIGVLCRFRKEPVAFMCDIEQMFHQFRVNSEDRNYLRFLWWPDENYWKDPIEMRMCVHLFGAASSPGCANCGLKQVATDNEEEFGCAVADVLRRDFYVDDGLKSLPSDSEAIDMIYKTKEMCGKGGLHLHKFISNSKAVIEHIPHEDRAKGIKDLDLLHDKLPVERALGIQWCVESDTFQFRIVLGDRPLTRRGILSTINSVYDPLGFLAPVLLIGKQILQCMCREKADWDTPLSDELRGRWELWRKDLYSLEGLQIQRCLKPVGFGEAVSAELHHFSDASTDGYGQCTYLRLINRESKVHCSLIIGKSRVAPLKHVTIPRLELVAALVSAKISALLKRELEYENITEWFWTDSKIVLGYIANNARRFHVFVANRVQQIREHTEVSQWRYVSTRENPADLASRGASVSELLDKSLWFHGPKFLWEAEIPTLDTDQIPELPLNDAELKKVQTFKTETEMISLLQFSENFKCFSSWAHLKRVIALCNRFIQNLKLRVKKGKDFHNTNESLKLGKISPLVLTVEELEKAEQNIVQIVQRETFESEIKTLLDIKTGMNISASKSALKRNSSIYRLNPFIDSLNILRVGGRMNRAQLDTNIKHPIILPKKCHVSELVTRYCHQRVGHQGRGMTINEVRASGFWVLGLSSAVSGMISRCVRCRKLRGVTQVQKMAELPEDRVEPSPPFTYCGVDYFGPWYIREGRKELKRYGVVFTCLCCRAIHLETATALTTDSFINALRRFIAIRGPVRQLRCDRGTNFIGAERELREAVGEMDENRIQQFLLKENCDYSTFKTNVPHASHMGGIWERQIRTVRNILSTLLSQHGSQLDDESLRTLMCETAAIVNSRPLSVQNANDPLSLEPLTPNNLLTMKPKLILPPPGEFQGTDMYSRKRWRRIQYLANEFWFRWQKEYLQTLQVRGKWINVRRNLEVGDIVLIKDENLARNEWHLGKVVETHIDEDGLVRKVHIMVGTAQLDNKGRRVESQSFLERPIHKLVLIQESDVHV